MNKKGNLVLMGVIFGMFLIALLGTIFAGTIADTTSDQINPIAILNETLTANVTGFQNATDINTSMIFNLTNAPWVTNSVLIYNASDGAVMTAGTDYFVDYTTSAINFSNGTYLTWSVTNDSNVNYSYFSANYIQDRPSRTFVGLIVLFFVIGVVVLLVANLKKFDFMNKL